MSAGEIDLVPGERVLWAGEPVHRPFFNKGDVLLIPFCVLWIGVVAWFLGRETDPTTRLILIALLVVGLGVSVGRMALRFIRLGKTTYAITDSRIIARSGLFRTKESSDSLAELAAPVIVPGKPGTGTITFGDLNALATANATLGARQKGGQILSVMLVGIGEPKRVRDLLVKAIEEAKRRQPVQPPVPEPDVTQESGPSPS